MGWKVITNPTSEQITIAEARQHLRLDDDGDSPASHPDDPWLLQNIPTARRWCERWAMRALAPQVIELALDCFPSAEIELPMCPVTSIVSVKYIDTDGDEQTLATNTYVLDNYQEPSWLLPAEDTPWPSTRGIINAVKVRYACGYSLRDDSPYSNPLPDEFMSAMKLVLGDLYENRENSSADKMQEVCMAAQNLMLPYRLRLSMA